MHPTGEAFPYLAVKETVLVWGPLDVPTLLSDFWEAPSLLDRDNSTTGTRLLSSSFAAVTLWLFDLLGGRRISSLSAGGAGGACGGASVGFVNRVRRCFENMCSFRYLRATYEMNDHQPPKRQERYTLDFTRVTKRPSTIFLR